MSLYGEYIKERLNKSIIEDEHGFATYFPAFNNEYMYIEDLYVKPIYRKKAKASAYADKVAEIARKKGIRKLLGSVDLNANAATESMKVLLAYGFSLLDIKGSLIYLSKEIGV